MALRPTFLFAAAAALTGTVRAQAPPPSPPAASVTESAHVALVLLPVTVLDRKGEPVHGLTAADFEVRDEGRRVRIESVDVEERPGSGRAPAPRPAGDTSPVFSAPRKLVLVFDLSSPSPGELADARSAAAEFVGKRMEPGDVAAVATVGEGRHATISPRFSGDRGAIVSQIAKVRARGNEARRDPVAGASAMMEEDAAAGARDRDLEYHAARGSSLADSLEELAGALAPVDGPKQLLLFSRGERGIGGASAALRSAQCEVDAIVTGGIAPAETSLSDRSWHDPRGEGGIAALDGLSSSTGGLLLRSGNDLADQLERLLRAESLVYVLGFAPSETGKPGRFHRVTVGVSRTGVRVVCRPGYLEPAG